MGVPERLVDRQLAGTSGDLEHRVRMIRLGQALLLTACVLGLFTALINLADGAEGLGRYFWTVVGVAWSGIGYVLFRQWRYLDQVKG